VLIDPAIELRSGLRFTSAVSCNNLHTFDQSRIIQVIGSLSPAAMQQIEARIKTVLGLP
jgi:mRNA-degrading endonuclease toxin of MazEF toxin-antitoxin module